MLEASQGMERRLPDRLVVVVIARDLNQEIGDFLYCALAGVEGTSEPADGRSARFTRSALIARNREEPRRRIDAVGENRRKQRIPAHASVSAFGEAEQVIARRRRTHSAEVTDTGRDVGHRTGIGRDRYDLAAGAVEDHANRALRADLLPHAFVPVSIPLIARDLDEAASVPADTGACRERELHSRAPGSGDAIGQRLTGQRRWNDQRGGRGEYDSGG